MKAYEIVGALFMILVVALVFSWMVMFHSTTTTSDLNVSQVKQETNYDTYIVAGMGITSVVIIGAAVIGRR